MTSAQARGKEAPSGANDDKAALAKEATAVFDKLKRALKQIALYRHNVDRYGEYMEGFTSGMIELVSRTPLLSVKLDATGYRIGTHIVFEDDSRENNIIYPMWSLGVRLLMFKQGVTADELQRFFILCMSAGDNQKKGGDDLMTALWKAELEHIEYIVVEGFKAMPDEDSDEVEIEVDKVVAYLYRQLQSNSEDYLRFARISSEDLELQLDGVDQMRGAIIQGVTTTPADRARIQQQLLREDTRQLSKLVVVLFQLLELDTTDENFEDVAEAFVQLLDALLLQENFTAIDQLRMRFPAVLKKPTLSDAQRSLIERCGERFQQRMGESQRIQAVGSQLNAAIIKDVEGVRRYLRSLGPDTIIPLLDMLETLQLLPNRRLVCDVLADLGGRHLETFTQRLNHPSSNFVNDLIYIIDKINPPSKFSIFAILLEHPNAILRLNTLAQIGKSGTDESFEHIAKTIRSHPEPQMRAQAMRMLPNFAPDKASALLLSLAKSEGFDKMEDGERKAIFFAIGGMRTPVVDAYLREIFEQKSGLFARKKVDEMKLLALEGLESAPSIPALQFVSAVEQDAKRHSKDVLSRARAALVNMKARLTGG